MILRGRLIQLLTVVSFSVLQCGKNKPPEPKIGPPDIIQFTATPTDITPGDSTLITYSAVRADSLILDPMGTRLTNATADSIYLKPNIPTNYTLHAYNTAGQDSASVLITMSSVAPVLTLSLNEDTIVIGDSARIVHTSLRADSIVLQGVGKLTPVGSGSRFVKPNSDRTYTAIAYGQFGNDTVTVSVRVEVPFQVVAVNGGYYKGQMGLSQLTPQLLFRAVDNAGATLRKSWIHFDTSDGNGALSADSLLPSASGTVAVTYHFKGALGRVRVGAHVKGTDTTWVDVRASVLTPGASGQAQFILLSDTYGTVRGFNAEPASVDVDPQYCRLYANYESAKGVVAVLEDSPCDGLVNDGEPVIGVIVNTVYSGKTTDGIGIGSTFSQVTGVYGPPDTTYMDNNPPPALTIEYWGIGMTCYCTPADSVVFEIHFSELSAGALPLSLSSGSVVGIGERLPLHFKRRSR